MVDMGSITVLSSPALLKNSRSRLLLHDGVARPTLFVWSLAVLRLTLHPTHAEWHDDHDTEHCRTYTKGGGCRCEVEESR